MSKDRLIPPMTQKEILADHERRLKALEKAVKRLEEKGLPDSIATLGQMDKDEHDYYMTK